MSTDLEHVPSSALHETAAAPAEVFDARGQDMAQAGSGANPMAPLSARMSRTARVTALASLQRSQGNAYVQRLLRQAAVQRDPTPAAEEPAPDLGGVGVNQQELPGHGQTGGGTAPATSSPSTATPASAGVVGATVNLTVNAPTIQRKPAREIASGHSRPGSAGWTTPRYTIADPIVHGSALTINVTLDFIIELDSGREDEALAVISDHEQGHVHIGTNKAQQHLVNGFKGALEALPRLTRSGYITAQNNAINSFTSEEGNDSRDYDAIDYPRMMRANTGATTPLSTLTRRFPPIAAAASALRTYYRTFISATYEPFHITIIDDATVIAQADAVIAATDGVPEEQLNLLQYNPGFKALVAQCRRVTNDYLQQQRRGPDFLEGLPSDENISQPVREKLEVLEAALGFYTWSAPV